jgi:hypothetical protein
MPAVRYAHHIDLDLNQLLDARAQNSEVLPPAGPDRIGQLIMRPTTGRLVVCDGVAWGLTATDTDRLGAQLPSYYLDRANQTGTQPASTVTGLTDVVKTVPLNEMASPTGPINLAGQTLENAGQATNGTDVPTWDQVMAFANNQDFRIARVGSTGNVDTTITGAGGVIDDVTLVAGDIVLLRNQTNPAENGLYVVQPTNMVRAPDADTAAELPPGLIVVIQEGTTHTDAMFIITSPPGYVMGTDPITFTPFGTAPNPVTAGNGISIVNDVISAVAATGITVGPAGIGVDFSIVSRHFEVDIPAPGTGTAVTLVHSVGRRPVPTVVMDLATGDEVKVGVNWPDTNSVTVDFSIAPSAGQYRVSVG